MLGKVRVSVCGGARERDENLASRVDKPTKRSIAHVLLLSGVNFTNILRVPFLYESL